MAHFLLLAIVSVAQASGRLTTDDLGVVQKKAVQLGKQYGTGNVLLVFDIDNTLLASDQVLGSDQWYDWQADLIERRTERRLWVAPDFKGLLRVQSILYVLGSMHPPQVKSPNVVKDLQAQGFHAVALTAREIQDRNATERHLAEGGYSFTKSAPSVVPGFRGRFMPYSLKDVSASGLSPEERERFHLGVPREVSYDQGVFMAAGQHKGAMLLIFLAHCTRHFSAIIFVDDKQSNTQNVFSAVDKRNIEIFTYRYAAEDQEKADLSKDKKQKSLARWRKLSRAIQEAQK